MNNFKCLGCNLSIFNLLRDSRIAELTKKYQFDKYAFSRLTDNEIFYYTRTYLTSFHLNNFRNYKMKSKISDQIWLRNEGLPTREGLFQLYIWFCQERGFDIDRVIEDKRFREGDKEGERR